MHPSVRPKDVLKMGESALRHANATIQHRHARLWHLWVQMREDAKPQARRAQHSMLWGFTRGVPQWCIGSGHCNCQRGRE